MPRTLFVLFLLFILSIFSLGLINAIDISGCQDINSDYFGQTLTLTQDINYWSNNCFQLTEDYSGQSLEINCNTHQVDFNATNQIFFSTNTYVIDTVTFRNCDLNIDTSTTSNELFYVDNDLNTFSLLDSNVSVKYGTLFDSSSVTDSNINLYFTNSNVNILPSGTGIWAQGSNYDYYTIYDLNVTSSGTYLIRNNGDLNYFNLFNSAVTLTNGAFFYTHNLTDNSLDLNYFGSRVNISYGNSIFYFNSADYASVNIYDLNYLNIGAALNFRINSDINNLNIFDSYFDSNYGTLFYFDSAGSSSDMNLFGSYFLGSSTSVLINYMNFDTLTVFDLNGVFYGSYSSEIISSNSSDINQINLFNSRIDTNKQLIDFENNSNKLDINFYGTYITYVPNNSGINGVFEFNDINSIIINDLNINFIGKSGQTNNFFNFQSGADLNYLFLLNSTISTDRGTFIDFSSITDSFIDMNFYNSDINNNYLGNPGSAFDFWSPSNIDTLIISDLSYINGGVRLTDLNHFSLLNSTLIGTPLALSTTNTTNIDLNFYESYIVGGAIGFGSKDAVSIFNLDLNYASSSYIFDFRGSQFNLIDSNINQTDGIFIQLSTNNSNTRDFNFYNSELTFSSSVDKLFDIYNLTNILNIYNFNSNSVSIGVGTPVYINISSDLNQLNIYDSNMFIVSPYGLIKAASSYTDSCFSSIVDNSIIPNYGVYNFYVASICSQYVIKSQNNSDINFSSYLSQITSSSGSVFIFQNVNDSYISIPLLFSATLSGAQLFDINDSNIGVLQLRWNTITSDKNLISLSNNSSIDNLLINSSIITLDSLISICDDCNVKSGLIYNNKLVDSNLDNSYIYAPLNGFNADFNESLTSCDPLYCDRTAILFDGAAYDGGNLWKNNSDTVCAGDSTHDGICDSSVEIKGSNENYFDYLPLVEAYVAYACKSITSYYLDNTMYIMADISDWSNVCFTLSASGIGKNVTIDCEGRSISSGASSTDLFKSSSYDLNALIFKDCNINLLAEDDLIDFSNRDLNYVFFNDSNVIGGNIFYHGSTADTFLDFNFFSSKILNSSIYNCSADVNYLEISDLNLIYDNSSASSALFDLYNANYFYLLNSKLDVNSSDGLFDLSGLNSSNIMNFADTNIILRGETDGFYSGIQTTNIYDLNVLGLGVGSLGVNSNLNVFDSTIDLNSGDLYFDSDNNVNDLNFYNSILNLNGSANGFTLFDSNAIIISDLNLNSNSSGEVFNIHSDSNVYFINSSINQNNGIWIYLYNSMNPNSSIDLNFNSSYINLSSDAKGILQEQDVSELNISDLNVTDSTSNYYFVSVFYDLNNVNMLNSTIRKSDGNFFVISHKFGSIDLNFHNCDMNLYGLNYGFFVDFDQENLDFNITADNISIDSNLFYFTQSDAVLNIFDSNILLDSLAYIDYDSNITSGNISNNVFYDLNTNNNFIVLGQNESYFEGQFNADFNSNLNLNNPEQRRLLLLDDSNAIGGNLWLDSEGNNLCTLDLDYPKGICDSGYLITNSKGQVLYDYLPIVEFNQTLDLNANNIDLNANVVVYGDFVDFNFMYSNNSNVTVSSDYNILFYINDVLISTIIRTDSLFIGDSNYQNINWDANLIGDVNANFCLDLEEDTNNLNDCITYEFTSYYRDISSLRIDDPNAFILGGVYNANNQLRLYTYNYGDYNSEDVNVNLSLWDDLNELNIQNYSWINQNIIPFFTLDFNYTPDFIGYLDYNIVLTPSQIDYNNLNNTITKIRQFNIYYFDFNSELRTSDVNAGHSVDVNCLTYDLGDAKDNGYNSDINVLFYVNNILEDYLDSTVSTFSWTPSARGDYNLSCLVNSLDYNDYNNENNYYSIIKIVGSDTNVDLVPTDINISSVAPGTKTITCDINNIGDVNAISDYNVKMYVNGALLGSNILNTQLNVGAKTSTTFSWTSAIGTYALECVVDYNVDNYTGYDANIINNSYSETVAVVCVSNCGGGPTKTPYNVKISSASATGNISKTDITTLNASITKSGTEDAPNFDLKVYVLNDGTKEQIDSKDLTQSDLPYSYTKIIAVNDLIAIDNNLMKLVDSTGKVQFEFEINISGDDIETDNNRIVKTNLNYFDAEIKNVRLTQGTNNLDISSDGAIDLDVTKRYSLKFDIYYQSINKSGNSIVSIKNKPKNKLIYYNSHVLGSNTGINLNSKEIREPFTILNLMSESEARNTIANAISGDLGNSETDTKVNDIIANLGGISTKESILPDNVIYFSGLSDELELSLTGDDDTSNNNYNFDFDYFSSDVLDENSVVDDENVIIDVNKIVDPDDKKAGSDEGSESKDANLNVVTLPKEDIYLLKYKSKLGLDENQEIIVYDGYNKPRPNLSLQVEGNNNTWYLSTDSLGKAVLIINKEGVYNIYVPYPDKKVSGIFEVIANYISSSSDFVEISNTSNTGSSKTTSNALYFLFISIIVIVIIGIVLYVLFKPRKRQDVYDFAKSKSLPVPKFVPEMNFIKEDYKNEIKQAYIEDKLIEQKLDTKINYDFTKTKTYKKSNYFTSIINKEYNNEFKLANSENKILEKRLKDKTGYDL